MSAVRKPSRYASKAEIVRLIQAARAAGVDVGGFEVSPDGTIRLLPPQVSTMSDFDRWKDRL